MIPPTLTAVDELTAAQIERIYEPGFTAGLNSISPAGLDAVQTQAIKLTSKKREQSKVIESQIEQIEHLKRDVIILRGIGIVMVFTVVVLLCILVGQREEAPAYPVVRPTSVRGGLA